MPAPSHSSCYRLAVLAYVAIVAVAVVLAWAFARDAVIRARRQSTETLALQQTLAGVRELLNRFQAEVTARKESGALPSGALGLLPADQQGEAFMKEVNAAAAKRGVQIPSVQSQPPVRDAEMARIGVQLVCKGSFHALHAFLHDVERGPVMARVESLSLRQDEPGACAMDVTCVVYGR